MTSAAALFREAQLELANGPIASIQVPSTSSAIQQALELSIDQLSNEGDREVELLDEDTFTQNYLASEASVLFRQQGRYPRTVLWRILDDRKLLELESVDLRQIQNVAREESRNSQVHGTKHDSRRNNSSVSAIEDVEEAVVKVQIRFQSPIRPFGLVVVDQNTHEDGSSTANNTSNNSNYEIMDDHMQIEQEQTSLNDGDHIKIFSISTTGTFYAIYLPIDVFFARLSGGRRLSGGKQKPKSTTCPCLSWSPAAFGFRYPYRLLLGQGDYMVDQAWISLHDGGLLRLTRPRNSVEWIETFFSTAGWGSSLRGLLLPWAGQGQIKFGDLDIYASSTLAMDLSPDGGKHAITVCLDHRLRFWNVQTGKQCLSIDIMGEDLESSDEALVLYRAEKVESTNQAADQQQLIFEQEQSQQSAVRPQINVTQAIKRSKIKEKRITNGDQYHLPVRQTKVLQVIRFDIDDTIYHVVTYSPQKQTFKIWTVWDADRSDNSAGIRDLRPDVEFVPPVEELMNTQVWTLEEFHFAHVDRPQTPMTTFKVWIRVRVGGDTRTFILEFNVRDSTQLVRSAWQSKWRRVDEYELSVDVFRHESGVIGGEMDRGSASQQPIDSTKWLESFIRPGRLAESTVEAALATYQHRWQSELNGKSRGKSIWPIYHKHSSKSSLSNHNGEDIPLKWRVYSAIVAATSRINSQREHGTNGKEISNGTIMINGSQKASLETAQWMLFFGLLRDLHKRRNECLSLVYDHSENLPWLIRADSISAIRACSQLEILSLNGEMVSAAMVDPPPEPEDNSRCLIRNNYLNAMLSEQINLANRIQKPLPHDRYVTLRSESARMSLLMLIGPQVRATLSADRFFKDFQLAIRADVLSDASHLPLERMRNIRHTLSGKCAYWETLMNFDTEPSMNNNNNNNNLDDIFEDLDGHETITNQLILGIIDKLKQQTNEGHRLQPASILTRAGACLLLGGARDTLSLGIEVIYDLILILMLLTFGRDESEWHEDFDPLPLFIRLTEELREHLILEWLVITRTSRDTGNEGTFMESLFLGDWSSMLFPSTECRTSPDYLTYWCRAWTFGANISHQYSAIACHVLSCILKQQQPVLGIEFLVFLAPGLAGGAWVTYLKARLALEVGNYDEAVGNFRRISSGLANKTFDAKNTDTASLLTAEEHSHFGNGYALYYIHIISLLEEKNQAAYIVELASTALQMLVADKAKNDKSRLFLARKCFAAALETHNHSKMHVTLTVYMNRPEQNQAWYDFVSALIEDGMQGLIVKYPWTNSRDQIDHVLEAMCVMKDFSQDKRSVLHQILAAFRISRGDFRGAATTLYEWFGNKRALDRNVVLQERKLANYLTVINILSCLDENEAFIIPFQHDNTKNTGTNDIQDPGNRNKDVDETTSNRQTNNSSGPNMITLAMVRQEYQAERQLTNANGRFGLNAQDIEI